MKKILMAITALAAMSSAQAGLELPLNYEEVPVKAPGTKMYVNKLTSAYIAVTAMNNADHDDARGAMDKLVRSMNCQAKITGDSFSAQAEGCLVNANIIELSAVVYGDKIIVLQSNSNVTDDEYEFFTRNLIPKAQPEQAAGEQMQQK